MPELGSKKENALALNNLGGAHLALGELSNARAHLGRAALLDLWFSSTWLCWRTLRATTGLRTRFGSAPSSWGSREGGTIASFNFHSVCSQLSKGG